MLEYPNLNPLAVYYNYCQCLKILLYFCLKYFSNIRLRFTLSFLHFQGHVESLHSIRLSCTFILERLFRISCIISTFCVVCMWSCSLQSLLIWCRFGIVIHKGKCFSHIYHLYNLSCFDVFSTVHHSIELFHQPTLMHSFLYSLTICLLHYYSRHVSSINMPIFRRKNCIHTASDIFALCKCLHSTLVESG